MKTYKNTSKIIKAPYNKDHPYTVVSNNWNDYTKLNGFERAIMLELMSNSDSFIINKDVVRERLGFPKQKFLDAWASLEKKYYISCDRFFGGVKWVINETVNIKTAQKVTTSEQEYSKSTSSITTDSITTLSHLISNKEISNKETSLETLVLKGDNRTNTISNADAFDSILDGASAPELSTKVNPIFNIQYQEIDMPSIDFNSDIEPL